MSSNLDVHSNSLIAPGILDRKLVPKNPVDRFLDISLIVLAAPYIILAFLFIIVSILIDSGGPVFYRHRRIGRDGRKFDLYKFRTMVQNADQVLQTYLDQSPELRAEWEATQKLQNDPRVTRVGALLRKTSLDELPQLWNILIGEMSIVGPRPIVDAEVERYGNCFELYKQVRPGLTGLWQVSGRSDTSYEHRVELDEYYILHRSFRLDVEIILKTIVVVLKGKGAY